MVVAESLETTRGFLYACRHLALATAPEAAFIDVSLPGMLVAFTVYGQERERRRSIAAGFDAHLVKSTSDEDVTRVLGRTSGGNG